MSNSSDKIKFLHFADDTNIYVEGENINNLADLLSNELCNVDKWLTANRLALNLEKTSFMIISHNHISDDICIKMRGRSIERVNYAKFLGITILFLA